MGRPSISGKKMSALSGLLPRLCAMTNNEAAVILMLRLMLIFGHAERALQVPKISGHRFEFPVAGGRIDLLLFHPDGGVTIVEAKGETADARDWAGGIGQLCLYAAKLPAALSAKQQPKYIQRVLCGPALMGREPELEAACALAGVCLVSFAPYQDFHAQVQGARERDRLEREDH